MSGSGAGGYSNPYGGGMNSNPMGSTGFSGSPYAKMPSYGPMSMGRMNMGAPQGGFGAPTYNPAFGAMPQGMAGGYGRGVSQLPPNWQTGMGQMQQAAQQPQIAQTAPSQLPPGGDAGGGAPWNPGAYNWGASLDNPAGVQPVGSLTSGGPAQPGDQYVNPGQTEEQRRRMAAYYANMANPDMYRG